LRLSVLYEGLDEPRSLLEDGEGMSAGVAGVAGDATAASAVGPVGEPVAGITTTADVAMYPKYLGFSYRGGTVRLKGKNKKRKSLHEEALDKELGTLLEQYTSGLSKLPNVSTVGED